MDILKAALLAAALIATPEISKAQLSKTQQRDSVAFLRAPNVCDGTGFFISGDVVLTCSHVAQTVRMEVWVNGTRYYGTVIWRNAEIDQAMLRVSGYRCKSPIKRASPVIAERSWAYGYPPDKKFRKTTGAVGFDWFWSMWAMPGKADPGMSGGPVVNSRGQGIGVISKQGPWGATYFEAIAQQP